MSARLRHILDGVLWSGVQTVLGRGVRLGGQLLLAYLLAPGDFGLFAMATAVSAVIMQFQDIGLGQVLLQRRERARFWEGPVLVLSLVLGLGTATLIILVAPLAAAAYGKEQVQGLLVVIALTAPFQALAVLPRRRLQRTLRFRRLALLQTIGACFMMGLTCLLAWLDHLGLVALGPYCFAIPIPVTALLMLALYASSARFRFAWPERLRILRCLPLIRRGGMVFLAGWLSSLSAQSDYAVLGLFFNETIVGLYFMAFTLSIQWITLFATVLGNVLAPSLNRIGSDPTRQVENTLTTIRVLALVGFPLAFGQAVVAEPLIHLLLPAKWHSIGWMVAVLSIGFSFRIVAVPGGQLWLAQGRYRSTLVLSIVSMTVAIPSMVAVAALASQLGWQDPGLAMAITIAALSLATAPIFTYIRLRVAAGIRARTLIALVIKPFGAALTAAAVAWLVSEFAYGPLSTGFDILLRTSLFAMVFLALAWPALHRTVRDLGWAKSQNLVKP